ncbi:4Fe-4S binding protein, partial [candidate division KSB1 bacterium]
ACGTCVDLCRFDGVYIDSTSNGTTASIDEISCDGCGVCVEFCPESAIKLIEKLSGEWYISESRFGPMVHARLGVAEGNSGKLVTLVRFHARNIAHEREADIILIDGSPGIGCPVIASITGVSLVLAVTEPTLSGLHDLERVIDLAKHFNIQMVVCINKYDINPEMSRQIEDYCLAQKLKVVGKIPYDTIVTKAQIAGVSVIEYSGKNIALAIKKMWREINYLI